MTVGQMRDLYELQQIDLKLEKLKKELKELPVFAQFEALRQELADAGENLGKLEGKSQEQQKRIKSLEAHLHKVEGERTGTEKVLYNGTITQSKELEQLERKLSMLLKEKRLREEEWLAAMETGEELQNSVHEAKDKWDKLRRQIIIMQKTGNEDIMSRKQEIVDIRQRRAQLIARVDTILADHYETKRQTFHGRPLAAMEQDICGGCRISVSSNTKALLARPDAVITCENCGRILVILT